MMKNRVKKLGMIILAAALLAGCSATMASRPEKFAGAEGEGLSSYVDTPTDIVFADLDRETKILGEMTKMLENDNLELYVGAYFDIAVRDKQTGKVFFSGEALYPEDGSAANDATLQLAASQLSVEYYDKDSMYQVKSSFPDCFLDPAIEQVKMEKTGESLRVDYTIGQKSDNYFFATAMRPETFEAIKAQSDQLIKDGILRKADYKNFLASYRILSTNVMSDTVKKEYETKYTNLGKLGKIYVLKTTISDNQKKNVSATFLAAGFTDEMIQAEAEAVGLTEAYASVADYFEIPLIYTLQGRDLIVSIDTPDIKAAEGLHLTRIYLLNTFAASSKSEAGYLFLPDGSGTVIDNATSVYGMSQLEVPFYGHDFGTTFKSFDTLEPHAAFPVFGIKQDDAAVFGIVSGNDAMAGAIGRVSIANLDYCSAYPYFNYYTRDYLNQTNNIFTFSQVVPMALSTVRYHFLYGEDANYSGMARYYQAWLEHNGALKKKEFSESLKLDVRLIGSIKKVVRTLGIPIKQVVATTTFKEARTILDRLDAEGIRNVDIVYSEVMNGSKEYMAPGKVSIHGQLGGLKGYNDLMDYANSLGYKIFTFADFGRIYKKGNGISGKNDVIEKLSRDTAVVYEGTTVPEGILAPSFINPERYENLVGRFLGEYGKVHSTNVYLPTLGYYLNGNYGENSELTRRESQMLTEHALGQLKDGRMDLKLDGGNAYILPWADSLINIATDSSASRLEQNSVPFLAMVLKGYIDFTGMPVNNAGDYNKALLETIENGAGLYCEIMAADPFVLSNTTYTNMYSVSSSVWLDEIIARYHEIDHELGGLANLRIYDHSRLADDVFQTTYENGARVIVNYSDQSYESGENKVEPFGYLVIQP